MVCLIEAFIATFSSWSSATLHATIPFTIDDRMRAGSSNRRYLSITFISVRYYWSFAPSVQRVRAKQSNSAWNWQRCVFRRLPISLRHHKLDAPSTIPFHHPRQVGFRGKAIGRKRYLGTEGRCQTRQRSEPIGPSQNHHCNRRKSFT